jgi:hypothetical protein
MMEMRLKEPEKHTPVGTVSHVPGGGHDEEMAKANPFFPSLECVFPCFPVQPEHSPKEGDWPPSTIGFEQQANCQIGNGVAKSTVFLTNPEYQGKILETFI